MDSKELGKFIATLRKEKQITQAELAKRLNVTDKAVSRWERGVGFPDINTLEPLADVLGVSMTELMKCKRNDNSENSLNDTDYTITASIDIANYQRQTQRKKILWGLILSILGVGVLVFCLYAHLNGLGIILDAADGPTSAFVAGKIGNLHSIIGGLIGCGLLLIGIIMIIRTQNNDK
jgi:transcriptional regulator with XRE-family HTH domain